MAPSSPHHPQDATYNFSTGRYRESFWTDQASSLHWHRKPTRALHTGTKTLPDGTKHPSWSWFADGEISTAYNCVDRHVAAGHGERAAIVWESAVDGKGGKKEVLTYGRLLAEVETLAGVLREEGVRKGDVVLIYSRFPALQ
jgi:propionyl-CoA synthetase